MSKATLYKIGDIQAEMVKIAELVIRETTKEVLKDFKEDYIQKYVYDDHEPNKVYHNPKGQEFKNAWEWEDIKKSANTISSTMFYNWKKMSLNTHAFESGEFGGVGIGIHGSEVGGWDTDERSYLAETLNKSGFSSGLWVSVDRKEGQYWNRFISEYVQSGKLKRVIDKHAKANGLTIS